MGDNERVGKFIDKATMIHLGIATFFLQYTALCVLSANSVRSTCLLYSYYNLAIFVPVDAHLAMIQGKQPRMGISPNINCIAVPKYP